VTARLPLAVPVGDPAGVGPVVSVRAGASVCHEVPVALFGDAVRLEALAARTGVATRRVELDQISTLETGTLGLVNVGSIDERTVACHAASVEGGRHQLRALEMAAQVVRQEAARALVTGPTSKAAIVSSGHRFVGQTEYLAGAAGLADDDVTMMFLGPKLRVALVTTHLAVANVPAAITERRVVRTVRHLSEALERLYPEGPRRLTVAGLNPHAGEPGRGVDSFCFRPHDGIA